MARHSAGAAALQQRTKIKVLNSPSVLCDVSDCNEKAVYLFRAGTGPIAAHCEPHAAEYAARLGMDLPMPMVKVLRAG